MRLRRLLWPFLVLAAVWACPGRAFSYVPSAAKPPAVSREFRGAWVATVANINWPSAPGLPVAQQQAELIAILDRAARLHLNAIIFQVRPACDALYASPMEPWSEYLTGTMGQAPKPFYDPLAFAVEAAHQRGLELHAWFNPFRARHIKALSPIAPGHVSRRHPQWVKAYGKYLWLDPGEAGARDFSTQVILDVVRRYDIDGVHLDDYFYPYPELDRQRKTLEFPDSPSWSRYFAEGGKLQKNDWRRQNVNRFVQNLHRAIKAEKPHVKFGISPFGIWRPGFPVSVRGFDAYDQLYADSRRWLAEGWLDYCSPQLYWPLNAPAQGYGALLSWWSAQNEQKRHLWPGLSVNGQDGNRPAAELLNQVRYNRQSPNVTGSIFWNVQPLRENRAGVADSLRRELYTQPALVPASPWIDSTPPAPPKLTAGTRLASNSLKISWEPGSKKKIRFWLWQMKYGNQWQTEIFSGSKQSRSLEDKLRPDCIALTAIDLSGNASAPTTVERPPRQ